MGRLQQRSPQEEETQAKDPGELKNGPCPRTPRPNRRAQMMVREAHRLMANKYFMGGFILLERDRWILQSQRHARPSAPALQRRCGVSASLSLGLRPAASMASSWCLEKGLLRKITRSRAGRASQFHFWTSQAPPFGGKHNLPKGPRHASENRFSTICASTRSGQHPCAELRL